MLARERVMDIGKLNLPGKLRSIEGRKYRQMCSDATNCSDVSSTNLLQQRFSFFPKAVKVGNARHSTTSNLAPVSAQRAEGS